MAQQCAVGHAHICSLLEHDRASLHDRIGMHATDDDGALARPAASGNATPLMQLKPIAVALASAFLDQSSLKGSVYMNSARGEAYSGKTPDADPRIHYIFTFKFAYAGACDESRGRNVSTAVGQAKIPQRLVTDLHNSSGEMSSISKLPSSSSSVSVDAEADSDAASAVDDSVTVYSEFNSPGTL